MKTTLCFTLTLLIFVTLTFAQNSSAQDTSPEFVVRQFYFYPSDREPSEAVDAKLDTIVKDVQQFYADEMERHGFDRKTFTLETDENGNIFMHRLKGKLTSSHYYGEYRNALDEIYEHFGRRERVIDLFFVDDSNNNTLVFLHHGIGGTIGLFDGFAAITLLNFDKVRESEDLALLRSTTAHELGHAFGLRHDYRDDYDIMAGGDLFTPRLSYCAAKWLYHFSIIIFHLRLS